MIRKSFYVFLYSILLTSLSAQYFTLSDESLDFGNVLVGGSYTLDLAIFSQADQTFSLSVPTYFTISETDFSMSVGEQKTIQITFTPPFAIDVSSYLIINSDLDETALLQLTATGINELSGSISGLLSSDYSPYNVVGPIIVESGNSLILEPGVTLEFNENTSLIIDGTLVAKGTPNELIKFIANEGNIYKGIIANEGSSLDLSFIYLSNVELGSTDFISNSPNASSFINSNEVLSSNIFLNENNLTQDVDDFNLLDFQSHIVTFVNTDYIEYFSGYWGNCSVNLNSDSFETLNCSNGNGYVELVSEFFIAEDESSIDLQTYTSGAEGKALAYLQIFNQDNFSYDETHVYTAENAQTNDYSLDLSGYAGQKLRIKLRLENRYSEYTSRYNWVQFNNVKFYNYKNTAALSLENSNISLTNSMFYKNNVDFGLSLVETPATLKHLTFEDSEGVYAYGESFGTTVSLWNSIVNSTNGTFDYNNFSGVPFYLDEFGHLDPQLSEAIDYGNPSLGEDACMGPGLGTSLPDAGMYGGFENCGYGIDSNIPDGAPIITNIGDIPQDQGGFVGIQYDASIFDYSHPAHEVSRYTFGEN